MEEPTEEVKGRRKISLDVRTTLNIEKRRILELGDVSERTKDILEKSIDAEIMDLENIETAIDSNIQSSNVQVKMEQHNTANSAQPYKDNDIAQDSSRPVDCQPSHTGSTEINKHNKENNSNISITREIFML